MGQWISQFYEALMLAVASDDKTSITACRDAFLTARHSAKKQQKDYKPTDRTIRKYADLMDRVDKFLNPPPPPRAAAPAPAAPPLANPLATFDPQTFMQDLKKQQDAALASFARATQEAAQKAAQAAAEALFSQQPKPNEPKPPEPKPTNPPTTAAQLALRPASPALLSISNASTAGPSQGLFTHQALMQQRLMDLEAQRVYDEEQQRQRQQAQAAEIAKLRWQIAHGIPPQ